jgi:hypothetical protein
MKVLVACEFSGTVRDAFAALGHDAWSCDLLPTEKPGQHLLGDALQFLDDGWDLMVAHPPCTYLANSGVRWLNKKDGSLDRERHNNMVLAKNFFRELLNAPINRIAIENPIQHKYGKIRQQDQTIQPWQFGHGEIKATCLWLKNLPKLIPTNIVEGRMARVHRQPPGENRWKERSRTLSGIAAAMASQWGELENCDCERPWPNKYGTSLMSNECPVHNMYPAIYEHDNQAKGWDNA